LRKIAEQGVAQAQDAYERVKAAAAEATNAIEETYTIAAQGSAEYNRKAVEAVCSNADIFFHFVRALLNVKSPAELLKLSIAHFTQQLEAMAEQTKELATLAQKVTNATAEPIKTGVNSIVKKVA
jgi:phasin